MILGKTKAVKLISGEQLVPGDPVPETLLTVEGARLSILDVVWVDGVDHEPAHWEVLCGPPVFSKLFAMHGDDLGLFTRAVQTIVQLEGRSGSDQERQAQALAIREQAYKGLSEVEQKTLHALLSTIQKSSEELKRDRQVYITIFLPEHRVSHVARHLNPEEALKLLIHRRAQVFSTTIDHEEDEAEEVEAGTESEPTPA